jgi:ribonuclease HI
MIIYVDGGHNKFTGDQAWARVVDEKSNDMIKKYKDLLTDMEIKEVKLPCGMCHIAVAKFSDVTTQQNNGAEMLALVIGLRIANYLEGLALIEDKVDCVTSIKSDSQLMVSYWSLTGANKQKIKSMDPRKVKYINEAILLRKQFNGTVDKISGDDNIADLGWH